MSSGIDPLEIPHHIACGGWVPLFLRDLIWSAEVWVVAVCGVVAVTDRTAPVAAPSALAGVKRTPPMYKPPRGKVMAWSARIHAQALPEDVHHQRDMRGTKSLWTGKQGRRATPRSVVVLRRACKGSVLGDGRSE